MRLILRIKPKKLNASALQPLVGAYGVASKDIIKQIEQKKEYMSYKKCFFILDIDVANRRYKLIQCQQPDSIHLKHLFDKNELTKARLEEYAEKTMYKSLAGSHLARVNELQSIMKSCNIQYVTQ